MCDMADMKTTVLLDDKKYNSLGTKQGGMGRIWFLERSNVEGYDPFYRPYLAVKTFDFMDDQEEVEEELNNWIPLDHVAVVPLLKIARLNYQLAAVMPLYLGSVDQLLAEKGPLSSGEITSILTQVVCALEYAYEKFELLHLDLKPSNVLLDSNRPLRVKLTDWGVSRMVSSTRKWGSAQSLEMNLGGASNGCTSYSGGTPLFMAPERLSGAWRLEPSADVYSLGMLAVVLATGMMPFRGGDVDPFEEVATGAYFENSAQLLSVHHRRFTEFCLHCLHPLPGQRPQEYRHIKRMLRKLK
jgi:serine/threonine protein kinase